MGIVRAPRDKCDYLLVTEIGQFKGSFVQRELAAKPTEGLSKNKRALSVFCRHPERAAFRAREDPLHGAKI